MRSLITAMAMPLAIVLLLLPDDSASAEYQHTGNKKMNSTSNRLVEVNAAKSTICVGRFLIDVPKGAAVVYGPARVPFHLSRLEGEGPGLDSEVKRALAKIEENREFARGALKKKESMLGKVLAGIGGNTKWLLASGAAASPITTSSHSSGLEMTYSCRSTKLTVKVMLTLKR
jgi:hypothetical protein